MGRIDMKKYQVDPYGEVNFHLLSLQNFGRKSISSTNGQVCDKCFIKLKNNKPIINVAINRGTIPKSVWQIPNEVMFTLSRLSQYHRLHTIEYELDLGTLRIVGMMSV